MVIELPRKLWTVEEYELMIEKGVLTGDDQVELIRGEIVQMAPIGPRHAVCVRRLDDLFHDLLQKTAIVSVQSPIRLHDDSEPQPDVALLKRRPDEYAGGHPTAEDILLLVEVSDTTLATDRAAKVPLYAEAGIAEVWLVNLESDGVEVYSGLVGARYTKVDFVGMGQRLRMPSGLVGEIEVDDVLG